MPAVQTVYDASPADGRPGMVANGETSNRITRAVEDAAGIAFGRFAFRGTSDYGCTATPAAGGVLGVVIANKAQTPVPGGPAADIVAQREQAAIMTLGAIFVTAGEDVTDGAQVYVTAAGAIVDTVGSNIIAPGWFFDETVTSGNLVRIVRR
jgi:hypothetical protein